MTKKKDTPKGRPVELMLNALKEYLELSKLLFANPEESIYDINELGTDDKFYTLARDTAKSLKVNWGGMAHGDSNRIMLSMLETAYQKIRGIADTRRIVVEFKVMEIEEEENGSTEN